MASHGTRSASATLKAGITDAANATHLANTTDSAARALRAGAARTLDTGRPRDLDLFELLGKRLHGTLQFGDLDFKVARGRLVSGRFVAHEISPVARAKRYRDRTNCLDVNQFYHRLGPNETGLKSPADSIPAFGKYLDIRRSTSALAGQVYHGDLPWPTNVPVQRPALPAANCRNRRPLDRGWQPQYVFTGPTNTWNQQVETGPATQNPVQLPGVPCWPMLAECSVAQRGFEPSLQFQL
jgi:hypothetical protein